jgi:phage shock protein A
MTAQLNIEKLDEQIKKLKQAAQALSDMSDQFPAVKRNTARILSSVKMLEMNVSDIVGLV